MLLKYMNSKFLFRTVVFTSMLLLSEPLLIGGRFSNYFCDSFLQVYQETLFMVQGPILSLVKQIRNSQFLKISEQCINVQRKRFPKHREGARKYETILVKAKRFQGLSLHDCYNISSKLHNKFQRKMGKMTMGWLCRCSQEIPYTAKGT